MVLRLLGPAGNQPEPDTAIWPELNELAETHRLQPHLHARLRRGELASNPPIEIAKKWEVAHRLAALSALAHRAELFRVTRLLETHGISSAALKGSWLAWYAYPAAAERPLRDVDMLVAREQADEAYEVLLAEEYLPEDGAEDFGEQHRHKPPLLSKDGIRIELHSALSNHGAGQFERQLLASCRNMRADDLARYPAAGDMLLHLVIHAAYGETRLDVGPLLVCDIDYLLAADRIDWASFWQSCAKFGLTSGAALILSLTGQWRRPGLTDQCGTPVQIPAAILEAAPDLLLQDPNARKSAGLLARFSSSPAAAAGHLLERFRGPKNGKKWQWLGQRVAQSVIQITDPDVRQTGERLAEVGAWLDSAG